MVMVITPSYVMADQPLTLDEAVQIVRDANPGLAAQRSLADAAEEKPSQAGSLPDPKLILNVMNLPTDSYNRAEENMTQLQFGFAQQIPFPGKLGLLEDAAVHSARSVRSDQLDYENKVVRNTRVTWWNLMFLDRAIEIVRKNQNLLRQFVRIAEIKYKLGKGLQQDVLLAQLELSKLLDKEIELVSGREQTAATLNALLDRSGSTPLTLPREVDETLTPVKKAEELIEEAFRSRPLLASRGAHKEAAAARLGHARKGYYPDFTLAATYGFREDNPVTSQPRNDLASVMMSMSIPLYAGSKQSRAIAQKTYEETAAERAYAETFNQVQAEIVSLSSSYRKSSAQAELFKTGIIPQAAQTVESMRAGYQVNKVDFLNLVRVQITLYNYEIDYWKSLASANQALASLKASVGQENVHE